MKFITSTITIGGELLILILSIVWRIKTGEIEPVIGIVGSGVALLVSIVAKFAIRPRIVLHRQETHAVRSPQGLTPNNPPIIRVGIDLEDQYWRLEWNYILEIRNNSSQTAYNLQINYKNTPNNTFVEGEIGKIEPLQPNEAREFKIKIVRNISGTYVDANRYLKELPTVLTQNFIVEVRYSDEGGIKFRTHYNWLKDKNIFLIF